MIDWEVLNEWECESKWNDNCVMRRSWEFEAKNEEKELLNQWQINNDKEEIVTSDINKQWNENNAFSDIVSFRNLLYFLRTSRKNSRTRNFSI